MEDLQQRRGPGRPPKYVEATQAGSDGIPADAPRRPRKPFGTASLRLDYPQRENFHRHWANEDRPGGIPRMIEAGYDHVKDDQGRNVSKVVGVQVSGQPQTAYLMEIPKEWFEEDMRAQQVEIDAKEAVMRRGELEQKAGDMRYVPSQGITIKHG